jgi:hypothetical protein
MKVNVAKKSWVRRTIYLSDSLLFADGVQLLSHTWEEYVDPAYLIYFISDSGQVKPIEGFYIYRGRA